MSAICYLRNDVTGSIIDKKLRLLGLGNLNNLSFHSILEHANWETEPQESLSVLYKKRAQQIRDTYDYIVLYFSGGSDSITMLNAFMQNGIEIDEVVVYVNTDTTDESLSGIQSVKTLRKLNFTNKITAVNINGNLLNRIVKQKTWQKYHSFSGLLHSFYRFRISFYEENGYIKETHRSGNVAHLFGGMFPKVFIDSGKVYSRINLKQSMVSSLDPDNIQFFTDVSMLDLHVKQCYVLARKLVELGDVENEETEQYKLSIRDEYDHSSNFVKNRGNTKTHNHRRNLNSQHFKLYTMYGYDTSYERNVLDYFQSIEQLSLQDYEQRYFLFNVEDYK